MNQYGNGIIRRPESSWRAVLVFGFLLVSGLARNTIAGDVEFNRDIKPILRETCFRCHGPDSGSRKGDFRLDRRDDAIKAGALVPGKLDESELITRIFSDDPEEMMPPPELKKPLNIAQKEMLKKWIASGAEYQPHWAFIAPIKIEPPRASDPAWDKDPIDRFLFAKMAGMAIKPSPEADRRTLARRASLDLTGLPPSPEAVDAFVEDESLNAYEKYVDRLLTTPAFGEHRARYWLDAARYGDTHGIHIDNYREIWAYRDWVIKAFNSNQPFDQFTIEQLAGDLLPNRSLDQQVASGFNRCNITTSEGGAINEEYLVLYARDRTETVSQVFLGLTMGCAVCHDHKFDPISQKEFYEVSAFFNNTTQAAMDGNVKDTPPTVFVPDNADRLRWDVLVTVLGAAKNDFDDRKQAARHEFEKYLGATTPELFAAMAPSHGQKLRASLADQDSAAKTTRAGEIELADFGDFEKDQAFSYGCWVKPSKVNLNGSLLARMDEGQDFRGWDLWLEGGKVAAHIVHKWPEDALKVVSDVAIRPNQWNHVLVTYDGSGKAAGIKVYLDGQLRNVQVAVDALKTSIRTKVPFKLGQRNSSSKVEDAIFRELRVYDRALPADEVSLLVISARLAYLAAKPVEKRPAPEIDAAFAWYLATQDPPSKELGARVATLEQEQTQIRARGTIAHIMTERADEAIAYILFRGDYDKRRDPVKADTPDVLPPMPSDLPKNRLGFARWLVRPEHPLTARVTVNRFWQEVFGIGLVKTAGDFGLTGDLPTHPELLDWLAVDFRDQGWDVKRFFKRLVMTAAYKQMAATTPDAIEKDPQNRLLARGPRYRMDAEMVRDSALAVSGLLVPKIGGPSVRPYQPDGVWEAVAMPGSDTRNYRRDSGEKLYRRSMYTFWKRSAPPASMDIFNAPSREVCTVRRERTNTPLQALATMNDIQFVEAARRLAEDVVREACDCDCPESRVGVIARKILSRPFRTEEAEVVRESLNGLLAYYKVHPEDAAKLIAVGDTKADPSLDVPTLAAWTMLANELMNLDEALNK